MTIPAFCLMGKSNGRVTTAQWLSGKYTWNSSLVILVRFPSRATIPLSLWLIGTVRAEPEAVISRAWVQSLDPAE